MNMQVLDARRDTTGGYKVDVSRGERVSRVSSEWFSRPADERYLSLSELGRSVRDRADRSRTRVVKSALIHVEANRSDPERLALILPGTDTPIAPTHWSFGQLGSLVGAPAAYLRQLPAPLAAINLQYGRERRSSSCSQPSPDLPCLCSPKARPVTARRPPRSAIKARWLRAPRAFSSRAMSPVARDDRVRTHSQCGVFWRTEGGPGRRSCQHNRTMAR